MQHQFGAWLSEIDYVGNHGLHLPVDQQYNALPAQYLSTVTTGFDMVENTKLAPTVSNPFYKVIPNTASLGSSKTTGLTQLLLPYPEFTGVSAYVDTATSTYHSLQISLLRRFTGGASLTSAFTWSKTMDSTQFLNPSDTHGWYGISPNDRTFRLATSGIYQLPFGTGRRFLTGNRIVSAIVGGWQAQGVYQVQSGQPLNFKQESTSPVYNGANPAASAWGRAAYKKSIPGPGKSGYWFNTANWVKNTSTTGCSATTTSCAGVLPGSRQLRVFPIGFDGLRADFLNQFDAGVQRNFTIYRESQLQFRAEAINVSQPPSLLSAQYRLDQRVLWPDHLAGQPASRMAVRRHRPFLKHR